jgi:hypothetical protein
MNKTVLWVAVAVVVVAAAGAFFFLNNTPGGISTLGNTSLRSLLANSASQKCTFSNGDTNGTIYVSAGRMRGDFSSKTGEVTAQSHMIITNNIAYVWIDGMNQGYRMPFEDMASTSSSKNNTGIDADARVATNCESWQATDASFSLPTDVSFNAVAASAASQQASPTTSTSGSANVQAEMTYYEKQCATCSAMTDKTAKAQCIAYFDCPAN